MSAVDSKGIQWRKAVSANGKEYQIGTVPNDSVDEVGPKGEVSVQWKVEGDYWKLTSPEVKNAVAITDYKLTTNAGFFNYCLSIINTRNYDYHFYDETGDSYRINTFRSGIHYVSYNSDEPTIVAITAV